MNDYSTDGFKGTSEHAQGVSRGPPEKPARGGIDKSWRVPLFSTEATNLEIDLAFRTTSCRVRLEKLLALCFSDPFVILEVAFRKTLPGRTDPSEDCHVRMRATTRESTSSSVFTSYSKNCLGFRTGLGKLWACFVNTVLLQSRSMCTLSTCFALEGQIWVVAKESIWLAKPKIFTAWLFTERLADSRFDKSNDRGNFKILEMGLLCLILSYNCLFPCQVIFFFLFNFLL